MTSVNALFGPTAWLPFVGVDFRHRDICGIYRSACVHNGPHKAKNDYLAFRHVPIADASHNAVAGCVLGEPVYKNLADGIAFDHIVVRHRSPPAVAYARCAGKFQVPTTKRLHRSSRYRVGAERQYNAPHTTMLSQSSILWIDTSPKLPDGNIPSRRPTRRALGESCARHFIRGGAA